MFDSGGNESPSLGRMPEAQPPDVVAFNAGIWMDRQLLDAYGYKDKPVTVCYESCYSSSTLGKEQEQADMWTKWATPAINDSNTDDVLGISRINFDGWRWLAFPLPGNYPGEKHPWPANSQWRWDKDGVVHYPLTFKRLIVELAEKVLHVTSFAPSPRREIYLKDLTVGQDDRQFDYVFGPDR